jgi:hypothetical protein
MGTYSRAPPSSLLCTKRNEGLAHGAAGGGGWVCGVQSSVRVAHGGNAMRGRNCRKNQGSKREGVGMESLDLLSETLCYLSAI